MNYQTGIYCSQACYQPERGKALIGRARTSEHAAHISVAKKGVPNLALRKPPRSRVCTQCGKTVVYANGRQYRADKARFCGTACGYAYFRDHPAEHPRWRGGPGHHYGPNWYAQAKAARKRDGYVCQHCGFKQGNRALDVHHLTPRRLFGDDYTAGNDLSNLITLCNACHMTAEARLQKRLIAPGEHSILLWRNGSAELIFFDQHSA